jgi:hypothetical protein
MGIIRERSVPTTSNFGRQKPAFPPFACGSICLIVDRMQHPRLALIPNVDFSRLEHQEHLYGGMVLRAEENSLLTWAQYDRFRYCGALAA